MDEIPVVDLTTISLSESLKYNFAKIKSNYRRIGLFYIIAEAIYLRYSIPSMIERYQEGNIAWAVIHGIVSTSVLATIVAQVYIYYFKIPPNPEYENAITMDEDGIDLF